ncbi:MAG: riboflavin synthase, partial [Isosphaeraceae bacterium]
MFTGLVQVLGQVVEIAHEPGGRRLIVEWPGLDESADGPITTGESIAVNGCCLTVVEHSYNRMAFQAGP